MNALSVRQLASFAILLLALAPASVRATCSTHPADVAPGVLGTELPTPSWTVTGDDAVDVQDVLVLLNGAVGKYGIVWAPPVGGSCLSLPGNLAPGSQDDGFSPPRWTPAPDLAIDVGDVLVALRLAVVLIELDPAWVTPILSDGQVSDRVVAGSVIDSVSSSGLPAVTVTAIVDDAPVGATSTDAGGNFLLQGLPAGPLTLSLDGSGSTAPGKFSTLEVQIEVDTTATTSVQPLTLADELDPAGATGKFTGDESGTVNEEIALSSGDGDVGLATGPGGKIEIGGEPADMEVDLSVVPLEGEDLPEPLTDDQSGEGLNSTGEVAVGPAEGKFTGGGAGLSAVGLEPGFDLTLPNRDDLAIGTMVDIWHWDGSAWANCTTATGRFGTVVDLGAGMTAVFAPGVANEGGLYAAALPIDLFCTSSLSGFVSDDAGDPLAGVFVGTSLGASGFTDEGGNFFIQDLPAYSGADFGDCLPIGYEVFVRGGVELGGATGGVVVDEFDVFPGFETYVGEIQLTVPDEGCLTGLVLSNGEPLSGPVTLSGPEPGILMADAQGRFSATGLTPGSYEASFLFPGEPLPREFAFEIVARECTAVRLAVNAGDGGQRLTVQVLYDDDDDFLTPNPPASGALVRLIGGDAVSASGLEAVAGADGLVVFDAVDPPYDLVAIIERPLPMSPGRAGLEGDPFMRVGAGLVTSAPSGQATVLLRVPLAVDEFGSGPEGDVTGTIFNAPTPDEGEFLQVAGLRRGAFDGIFGGFFDPQTGDYGANGYVSPFDIAVALTTDGFPGQVREMAFFGPFQLPEPTEQNPYPVLNQDLDYMIAEQEGDRLVFNFEQPVTYSGFETLGNSKLWAISGRRMDGRSFWAIDGLVEGGTPFPPMITFPNPASTDLGLALEFSSESDVLGVAEQACLVPLPGQLPPSFEVTFSLPASFTGPAGPDIDEFAAFEDPITYEAANNLSARGFDAVVYEHEIVSPLAGEPSITSFMRISSALESGSSVLGPTPLPFVFPEETLWLGLDSFRSDAFPASIDELFGPDLESILQALPNQPSPTCVNSNSAQYNVVYREQ